MQDSQLSALYSVLGLQPDCSWDELRKAYRRQSRQWHPDRYALPSEHKFATERMKAINHAYAELSRFHNVHGRLPSDTDLPGNEEPKSPRSPQAAARAPSRPEPANDHPGPSWTYAPERARTKSRFSIRLTAVVVGLAVVYGYVVYHSSPSVDDPELNGIPEFSHDGDTAGISVGATQNQVVAAQGRPDEIHGSVWHFGNSRVFFVDGVVNGWDERPDSPLQLSTRFRPSAPARMATIQKGSTMAQVRAVQGDPIRANDSVWEYGPSRIYFKDGRVVSWHESPLLPLRVTR